MLEWLMCKGCAEAIVAPYLVPRTRIHCMNHLTTMVVLVVMANLAITVTYLMMAGVNTSRRRLLVAAGATRVTLLTATKNFI